MNPKAVKKANIYFEISELKRRDALIYYGQEEESEYYQVENIDTYEQVRVNSTDQLASIYLRLDTKKSLTIRTIYSILMMIGDIGGVELSFSLVGYFFVAFVQNRKFYSAVMKRIYQVKKKAQPKPKKTAN